MMRDDDALLRAAQRDPAAFEAIFDRYHRPLHRFAAHRLGAAAADDVASEVFVRAYRARRTARTVDGSLRAWLYTIASNLIRDELRARHRRATTEERARRTSPPPAGRSDDLAGSAITPDLAEAVLGLRDVEREVLLLHAWGELDYDEIAVVTGVAVGTVRTRMHRARVALRTDPSLAPSTAPVPAQEH